MSRKHIDARALRAMAAGHWLGLFDQLAPELTPAVSRAGRHVPCPVHGGKDGFRLFGDVQETGGGICATCGAFPDGLALLGWLKGWRFPEVVEAVAGALGNGAPTTPAKRQASARRRLPSRSEKGNQAERIARLWAESHDPADARAGPLRTYLQRRHLDPNGLEPDAVRMHPSLGYWEEGRYVGRFPAMLARVVDPDGETQTLHRTYLSWDGVKAPVCSPKKLMPCSGGVPLAGGAIRLFRSGQELGIAEGIETALAVRRATGMPVWSAVCASLMSRFEPPTAVGRIVIWADRDVSGAGDAAARALRERLLARGIDVTIRLPDGPIPSGAKGVDWADVWSGMSGPHRRYRAAA